MELVLDSLRDECCNPYLNDILCYAMSFEDHVTGLRRVLRSLRQHGIKLRPTKCELFKREVRYVGRLVSEDGMRIDPKDLAAVQVLRERIPRTAGEVRKLVGFLSYYRAFVQDFARIAKPFYDLLQVKGSHATHPSPRSLRGGGGQLPSKTPVLWTLEHQEVLGHLINIPSSPEPTPTLICRLCYTQTHRQRALAQYSISVRVGS